MKNIKAFIFGILAALAALAAELIFSNSYFLITGREIETTYFNHFTFFLIIVVLLEEISKYVFIARIYSGSKDNLLMRAFYVGLGFSFFELILFALNQNGSYFDLAIIGVMLLHIITATFIGRLLSAAKTISFASAAWIISITAAMHMVYNLFSIYGPALFAK